MASKRSASRCAAVALSAALAGAVLTGCGAEDDAAPARAAELDPRAPETADIVVAGYKNGPHSCHPSHDGRRHHR